MRDNAVSIAKSIAIILMVLAHTGFSVYGNYWINMFNMPLFFFFSGYCFKPKYFESPRQYFFKKLTSIYWPFIKWSIIFLLLHNVFFRLNVYNDIYGFRDTVSFLYSREDFVRKFIHIIIKMNDTEQLLGGYWFLKTFFVSSILGYIVLRLCKRHVLQCVGILMAMTIVLAYMHIQVPYFGIGGRELFATVFFVSGYLYKKDFSEVLKPSWMIIIIALSLITLGLEYWQATLLDFSWWQVVPYYITAIVGILAVFRISKYLDKCKIVCIVKPLTYIGNNTLTILTWHMLSFKIVSLLIILYYSISIDRLAEFPTIEEYSQKGWFLLYTIVGIGIPMLLSKIKFLR